MKNFTTDTFFNGRIKVWQNLNGYRFSIDAVLLAGYAAPRAEDKVIDLGTGCAIVPMILAYRNPTIFVYGIEVQEQLAEIACLNIKENKMDNRVKIICRDMKTLKFDLFSGPVDLVVSNPPYRKSESGRINPNMQRAVARHELKATLTDVVQTAGRMLSISGRFIIVYPAERISDLLINMRSYNLEPKKIRMVHSRRNTEAKLILVEGVKGGRPGIKIAPPLFIYRANGSCTKEVKEIYGITSKELTC